MSVGKLFRLGLPFSNVVATGVATASVTPGRTIHRIILKLGGTTFTKAMLTLIKVKANGKVVFEGSGSQIDKLQTYRGITANAAYLTLDFSEIRGRDLLDQFIGAWDTSVGIENITIEATIAGATAPTLEYYVVESGKQADPYGPIMAKLLRYPYNTATGGKLPIVLPFGQSGAVIKRAHFEHSGGFMTALTVKQDGLVIHESVKAVNEFVQVEHGRTPQANIYTCDFIVDSNQNQALDTRGARSMEWVPEFSAADSGYVMVEYYDTLGNL
jgi:hypothetical protein